MKKIKLTFIIPNLNNGGAERVVSHLLGNLDREIFELSCVFYDSNHSYPIPGDIKIFVVDTPGSENVFRKIYASIVRLFKIRNIINFYKPDVILSFLTGVNITAIMVRMLARRKPRLIISERSTFSQYQFLLDFFSKTFFKYSIKFLYNYADCLIAVSKGVKEDLQKFTSMPEKKLIVIHNPVDIDKIIQLSNEEVHESRFLNENLPVIVHVGSLTKAKGHEYLLQAFKLASQKVNCRLLLLGEGERKDELVSLAAGLGINNMVEFLGFNKNPYKFMRRSSVFVLSSIFEGFPNVLIEAMASGTPVISTNCKSGPNEIIDNGVTGILVPPKDAQKLADAMVLLLTDTNLADKLKKNAQKKVPDFHINKIIGQYRTVLAQQKSCN